MSIHELLNLHTWLAQNAMLDTHQALAHLAAWLDPVLVDENADALEQPSFYEGSPEEYLMYAISICRTCFIDVYAELVQKLRSGCSEAEVNNYICDAVNQRVGTEIDDIEWMTYGIPVPFTGVDIELDEFWEAYPSVVPIMACFGIGPQGSETQRCGDIQKIVIALIEHLEAQDKQPFNDLAVLVKWLFSGTGNSLMDYTEEYWNDGGFDWLMWTPADVEFAAEMIKEAHEMMDAAMRGIALLSLPNWYAAFKTAVDGIEREVLRRKKGGKSTVINIEWPHCVEYPVTNSPAA